MFSNSGLTWAPDQVEQGLPMTVGPGASVDVGPKSSRVLSGGIDSKSSATGWTSQSLGGLLSARLWREAKARRFGLKIVAGADVYRMRLPPIGEEMHPRFVQLIRGYAAATMSGDGWVGRFFSGLGSLIEFDIGATTSTTPVVEPTYSLDLPLLTTGHWLKWTTADSGSGQTGIPGTTGSDWAAGAEASIWVTRVEGHYWT